MHEDNAQPEKQLRASAHTQNCERRNHVVRTLQSYWDDDAVRPHPSTGAPASHRLMKHLAPGCAVRVSVNDHRVPHSITNTRSSIRWSYVQVPGTV